MNTETINQPIPTEYCPHTNPDSPGIVGGWVFNAEVPPRAVAMCRKCLDWCHDNLSQPQSWADFQQEQQQADDLVLSAEIVTG